MVSGLWRRHGMGVRPCHLSQNVELSLRTFHATALDAGYTNYHGGRLLLLRARESGVAQYAQHVNVLSCSIAQKSHNNQYGG